MPSPWFPCCGPLTCDEHCSDVVPTTWQVVLADIVDDSCADCDSGLGGSGFNDTWVVSRGNAASEEFCHDIIPGSCVWSYDFSETICTAVSLHLVLYNPGFPTFFGVFVQITTNNVACAASTIIQWEVGFDDQQDCEAISGLDVPFDLHGSQCNGASSTCTITAL